MSLFEPVTFNWKGRDFTIPSERIMGAIATVEDIITLGEIAQMQSVAKINLSKIAKAYSAVLRYAGATDADWETVYSSIFQKGNQGAIVAIQSLMMMMVPPRAIQEAVSAGKPSGKKKAERNSSSRPTRSRSALGG